MPIWISNNYAFHISALLLYLYTDFSYMLHFVRNKSFVIAVLVLFASIGVVHIACGMGSCFCIKEVSCPPKADALENEHHGESHSAERHTNEHDGHHKTNKNDSEDNGCCPSQKCCDTISQIYLNRKAVKISASDVGQSEVKLFVRNESIISYATYLVNTNSWIKWARFKSPPLKNIDIRIFIQSFLN